MGVRKVSVSESDLEAIENTDLLAVDVETGTELSPVTFAQVATCSTQLTFEVRPLQIEIIDKT